MSPKPLVVTFRLDEATRDRIRETVRYSPHRTSSAFIREAIEQLLKREGTAVGMDGETVISD